MNYLQNRIETIKERGRRDEEIEVGDHGLFVIEFEIQL